MNDQETNSNHKSPVNTNGRIPQRPYCKGDLYQVYLGIGSNIQPVKNLKRAVQQLKMIAVLKRVSSVYETQSYGSPGPNFLNASVLILTKHPPPLLKFILNRIELQLGRIRTEDKNAPRTIDLDIMLIDGHVADSLIWSRAFAAVPLAEINPSFIEPETNRDLSKIAADLAENTWILHRKDLNLLPGT